MSGKDDARVWQNISGAEPWAMPEFDSGKADSAPVEEEVEPAPPTAAELHVLQQRAYDEAYAKGKAEGFAAGQQELEVAVERLKIIAAELAAPLDELDRDLEYSLSNLALILARRIVGKAVQEDGESLSALIRQAVEVLGQEMESPVDVYLNPHDLSFLNETVGPEANWRLHPDPELQSGDLRVKRGLAEVDARLQQRLDRLAAEMLHAR